MSAKSKRQSAIATLINSQKIHTQEDMLFALNKKGIFTTQATLSRDIKELGAHKAVDDNGETYYTLPIGNDVGPVAFILSIETSGQLGVAHTRPGFASALASLIDGAKIDGVMGTIAGDDTVLIIFKIDADAASMVERIRTLK